MPRGDSGAGCQQAEGAPAPKKQGLGAALRDKHIARRFFILAYAFLVMCMVSNAGDNPAAVAESTCRVVKQSLLLKSISQCCGAVGRPVPAVPLELSQQLVTSSQSLYAQDAKVAW